MSHDADRSWNRFLAVSLAFLAFESLLILVFGDYFYPGVSSELGAWVMVGVAALGYLALGALSGSPASLLVFFFPVLVALSADPPVPSDAWGGEFSPFYVRWTFMSIVFLPAWALGVTLALYFNAKRRKVAEVDDPRD